MLQEATKVDQKPDFKKDFLLSQYWDLCYRAHVNVSFSPERRADMYVKDYSEQLEEDLKTLGDNQGNYKEKYIRHFTDWMSAKTRCLSSMITGPANFPTRRAEKANNSEHNHFVKFETWRAKYFKAVNRERTLSPEEDLEKMYKKLDDTIILNEKVKDWNKSIRSFKAGKIDEKQLSGELAGKGMVERSYVSMFKHSFKYSYWNGFGTLAADIKRQKERIEALKSRIETKSSWEDITFEGGYITVDDDRVKVFHDEKPEQQIINDLKRHGFKWSRFWGCWCRKHTAQAIYDAKRICA